MIGPLLISKLFVILLVIADLAFFGWLTMFAHKRKNQTKAFVAPIL